MANKSLDPTRNGRLLQAPISFLALPSPPLRSAQLRRWTAEEGLPQMSHQTMTNIEAQRDMRLAYFSGAPGMFASALAWSVAGIIALQSSASNAVLALFVGGMLIHPVGVLLCKALGRQGKHSKENPLGALALESTVWLIFSLPIAYAVSLSNVLWFFPSMLLVIGGRYFTFHTLFGLRIYWVCGGVLAFAGYLLAASKAQPYVSAFAGAAIEAVFAAAITLSAKREMRSKE